MVKEQQSFGYRASNEIIDFTYPSDLLTIIFSEWITFEPVFGKDTNYWGQHLQLIAKIRNPLAHNRLDVLTDYEKEIAEGYCKEILMMITNWKNSQKSTT